MQWHVFSVVKYSANGRTLIKPVAQSPQGVKAMAIAGQLSGTAWVMRGMIYLKGIARGDWTYGGSSKHKMHLKRAWGRGRAVQQVGFLEQGRQ